jgi:hypothetical protein
MAPADAGRDAARTLEQGGACAPCVGPRCHSGRL